MKQTISVLVENQAGVLNRITSLFSRRAFNIDSLAVGVTDDPAVSRITIIVESGNSVVEQVEKQLNKLVEVIKVRTLDEGTFIGRELMILKVSANSKTRTNIMTICGICGAKVSDISPVSMTMELSDTPDRLDSFQEMMRTFNILEVVRTGVIALQKGGGKI
ncbi:acetolactate synthase small subunit [uncultured Oscillibacter sp.]|uniref:acetolactate synthase small subunit n=1 Tax=uncultured Oscillibacter sp. TaxID=876091 RepID=UPI0025E3A2B7|nr:acetolactate synthase small subunit [uncultured Oscillibacter sp.]